MTPLTRFNLVALYLLVVSSIQSSAAGNGMSEHQRIELKASNTGQLQELLVKRSVDLMFRDGTYVRGRIKAVSEQAMLIDVKSSEGRGALSDGEQRVEIAQVSTIQITLHKGFYRALLAAGFGAGSTLPIAVAADKGTIEVDTMVKLMVPIVPAALLGGYYLGRQLDRTTVTIMIQPVD